ncbi:MAG: hypothetical protein GY811_16495 [Myxococcales bacterium]|nr:hypothetical protein [Myxococcales bacterium]
MVSKIANKSLAETELVLKRVLDNGRREEISPSKADLLDKISAVPHAARWVFAPLGLGEFGEGVGKNDPTNRVDSLSSIEDEPTSLRARAASDDEKTKVSG